MQATLPKAFTDAQAAYLEIFTATGKAILDSASQLTPLSIETVRGTLNDAATLATTLPGAKTPQDVVTLNSNFADALRDTATAYSDGLAGEIQHIAWEHCGIVRSAAGLEQACARLDAIAPSSPEERSMRQVAWLIARCALARKESRGAHFRIDFPGKSAAFEKHSVVSRDTVVAFR